MEEESEEFIYCKICKVKSPNLRYSHYGGKGCCFSCKAFFRRAVQAKKKLQCKGGNLTRVDCCDLESQLPYPCRSCRFKACLDVGMAPQKVNLDQKGAKDQPPQIKELNAVFTFNEMSVMFQTCHDWINMVKDYCKVEWYDLGHELATVLTKREKLPWIYISFNTAVTINFVRAVSVDIIQPDLMMDEGNIKCFDRNLEAAAKFVTLASMGLDLIYPNRFQKGIYGIDSIWWNDETKMNFKRMVYTALNHQNCENLPDIMPCEYNMMFSTPWLASLEDELRHKEIAKKISLWPMEGSKSNHDDVGEADALLHHIMFHIIVFSTKGFENEVTEAMRNLQAEYLTKFKRYLRAKHPKDYEAKISEGLEVVELSMEAADLESKMLPL